MRYAILICAVLVADIHAATIFEFIEPATDAQVTEFLVGQGFPDGSLIYAPNTVFGSEYNVTFDNLELQLAPVLSDANSTVLAFQAADMLVYATQFFTDPVKTQFQFADVTDSGLTGALAGFPLKTLAVKPAIEVSEPKTGVLALSAILLFGLTRFFHSKFLDR